MTQAIDGNDDSRPRRRVLVVEDDANLLATLRYNLAAQGYQVLVASDGPQALAIARSNSPDLLILDVMLPGISGLDVCRALRQEGSAAPILMLSARGEEIDRVVGLEVGADDYVTKPFSVRELLARVAAAFRRMAMDHAAAQRPPGEVLEAGDLVIDLARRAVRRRGKPVSLRPREYDLLAFLASRPGRVFSRRQLLEQVWGYEYAGDSRTVDVHVRWIRRKIEDVPACPRRLLTVRGVGYRFEA